MDTEQVFIRRPIGGRKFLYFCTNAGDWTSEVYDKGLFGTQEVARVYMKSNKSIFSLDDEVKLYKGMYDGKFCPYCNEDNTLRIDATERALPNTCHIFLSCINCNTQLKERYGFQLIQKVNKKLGL